ncbi:hypothetical protein HLRTI_001563 [Halorhabdus tiamatea SARL4B]|uniref:Hypothetical membrane protein n=1 Tax=Halorhabdus tiamatea SARL4B TaxID=1033806 RepID=F7PM33_9EURY|nr:hypothetical protein [Halorhabdus tiamatea]ERJ06358.1 hypothetical protein HLRTI_001563 [Halorhabdus tiamatea SARL4B]CCQ34526.1 hypothetical membrane protein [Halorhabdus tiamatea SARL4B]
MATRQQGHRIDSDSIADSVSIGGGLIGGVLAYVLGYGVIALSKSDAIDGVSGLFGVLSQFGGEFDYPAGWKLAGWVFYRAHNVDVLIDVSGSDSPNPVALTESVFWEPWFFAVPVVALVVLGAVVAYATAARSAVAGAVAGGSVVFGYVLVVAVGVVVTGWSTSVLGVEASAGPDLVVAILLAGIAYPLVIGGIGGTIGGLIRGR